MLTVVLCTYFDIQTFEDWWDWHETVLLDSFYVGTQFTCFTGTNVQILTQMWHSDAYADGSETTYYDDQTIQQVSVLALLY
jgi:hypothetical protein